MRYFNWHTKCLWTKQIAPCLLVSKLLFCFEREQKQTLFFLCVMEFYNTQQAKCLALRHWLAFSPLENSGTCTTQIHEQ